ncbi:MAG TPA: hypothetical protein VNL71_23540 [Chloroflexota bacterium]|nr:hypothetical protein [Chloroflexota bacterium]
MVTPECREVQEAPPFFVVRIVPASPAMTHDALLAQEIAQRSFFVPDRWDSQLRPPSSLAMMVPPAPTARQEVALRHVTAFSSCVVPDGMTFQVFPPKMGGVRTVLVGAGDAPSTAMRPAAWAGVGGPCGMGRSGAPIANRVSTAVVMRSSPADGVTREGIRFHLCISILIHTLWE